VSATSPTQAKQEGANDIVAELGGLIHQKARPGFLLRPEN